MKPKKITTSRIVFYISWVVAIAYIYLVLNFVFTHTAQITVPIATILTATTSMLTAVVTVITKAYYNKSGIENTPKVRLGVIQELVRLQRDNPDLKIYDTTMIRADVADITTPMKKNEQKKYENIVLEDVTAK